MKSEEYQARIAKLAKEYTEARDNLHKEYAFSASSVKVEDIVTDHVGSVRVEVILWTLSHSSGMPVCVYRGEEFTKSGKPFKKKSMRDVYQTNLKEVK